MTRAGRPVFFCPFQECHFIYFGCSFLHQKSPYFYHSFEKTFYVTKHSIPKIFYLGKIPSPRNKLIAWYLSIFKVLFKIIINILHCHKKTFFTAIMSNHAHNSSMEGTPVNSLLHVVIPDLYQQNRRMSLKYILFWVFLHVLWRHRSSSERSPYQECLVSTVL
jgi:hypothetical protein